MKVLVTYFLLFNYMPLVYCRPTDTPQIKTSIPNLPQLTLDVMGLITEFSDNETAFKMSLLEKELSKQNQKLIDKIKLKNLREKCPMQFYYLTSNAFSMFLDSYTPIHDQFFDESGNSKEIYLNILKQQRLCIHAMIIAKDLISSRLRHITITMPPHFADFHDLGNLYLAATIEHFEIKPSMQEYFASIKLLVDTGLVKKITISPSLEYFDSISSNVEELLYTFLLSLDTKVSALKFDVSLGMDVAMNEFLNTTLVKDLSFVDFNTQRMLSSSIKKLKISSLYEAFVPNIEALDVHFCLDDSDLFDKRPKLKSLKIKIMHYDGSFFNSICSKHAHQLKELSLGFTPAHVDTLRLHGCLMKLKPTLRKLLISSRTSQSPFWNKFSVEYLQNNTVIKDFSILYEFPSMANLTFLDNHYTQLHLTRIMITGRIDTLSMNSIARFVSTHTSLQTIGVYFLSNDNEDDHLLHLPLLFTSIAENQSIQELDLTFELTLEKRGIQDFIDDLIACFRMIKVRPFKLNGLEIGSVIRDLTVGLGESFEWKEERGMVSICIASEMYQNELY